MMALRKKMASMDSTQKAEATRKMRKRQMTLRKKQAKIMQQEAKKEGINPKRVQRIMRSTRQDSTLQQRLRQAMKAKMKQQGQMGGGQEGGQDEDGGSSNP
jgi:O-methyltransferase involved in polyketide biosynthesis